MPDRRFDDILADLEGRGRRRSLEPTSGLDFTSNDYLALSSHPGLRAAVAAALDADTPIGAGGSRLLRGNHPLHEDLETKAARFFGSERSLFMGTGYLANLGLFSALPHRHDLLVFDELLHASAKEGIHASPANRAKVAHNDVGAIDDAIQRWRAGRAGGGRPWIAVESVYSMDGDTAPLAEIAAVADRYDAMLVIDEAHATGALGPGGRGLGHALEGRDNVIVLHTCGKALGAAGALVCASADVVDVLVNRCRPFIYSTAPSPLIAVAVAAALDLLEAEPELQNRLATLVSHARRQFAGLPGLIGGGTHIQPVVIGGEAETLEVARSLQANGFDVRAIRPPTVPDGTSRLRISLTLNVTTKDVDALTEALRLQLFDAAAKKQGPSVGRRSETG